MQARTGDVDEYRLVPTEISSVQVYDRYLGHGWCFNVYALSASRSSQGFQRQGVVIAMGFVTLARELATRWSY